MNARLSIVIGSLWAGLGVTLGAFGAHALKDRLIEAGQLDNWHTAVRYQVWHALALILVGILSEKRERLGSVAILFLIGSLLFSGSIYCLSLGVLRSVMGPVTPLGGLLLMIGWVTLAWRVGRAK